MTWRALTTWPAEGLADGLVPQADAQDGHPPGDRWISGTEIPASLGVQGPGEITMRSGAKAATPRQVNLVVTIHPHLDPQLPQILHQVIGEGIVVVDHQQHSAPNLLFLLAG